MARALAAAEDQTRQAVQRTKQACEDQMRAQDRQMRAKFGPLAQAILPPAPVAPKKTLDAPSAKPASAVNPTDIAENIFPAAPQRPDFLKFLPNRSPYAMCLGILAGMTTLLMGLSYWMLRRRVIR